jgi:endogenous inhibitor of DNA gyrase (YacG/DUF329 family)
MSWSNEHKHQIIEQFWRSGTASCPEDNGPLKLRLRKLRGGDYDLLAECLFCGKSKELRRADDLRRSQFRAWTSGEIERLTQVDWEKGQAECPVCGAKVERFEAAATSRGPLLVRCFRCGNSNQWRHIPYLTPFNGSEGAG